MSNLGLDYLHTAKIATYFKGVQVHNVFVLEYITLEACMHSDLVGLGRVAQSVTCPTTDASLTADPGAASSIPAQSHTFVEIDHEIISTVILLPSTELFKKGCCQL